MLENQKLLLKMQKITLTKQKYILRKHKFSLYHINTSYDTKKSYNKKPKKSQILITLYKINSTKQKILTKNTS